MRWCESGLELDAEANARCRPDADVATPGSPARILVIATREDLTVVAEVLKAVSRDLLENPTPKRR